MHNSIGEQLKASRIAAGKSLRDLAKEANVSPSFLSQIENGKSQPSVATLFSLLSLLGAPLDSFFQDATGAEPSSSSETPAQAPRSTPATASESVIGSTDFDYASPWASNILSNRVSIVHPDHRPRIEVGSGIHWERLAATPETSVNFMLLDYEPGSNSTPDGKPIVHEGYEYGYIIEGELEVTIGDTTFVLGPNQSMGFDCSIPHVFRNTGSVRMRGVWTIHAPHGSTLTH